MASTSPPQADASGFAAGYQISGYRLEKEIGRGGMAVVFAAYDERLERQVALKILAPSLAQDQVFRKRFIAESRAAAAVEDPHIIPVYEAGEADNVLFIAMRLVRGGDLRTLVTQTGPLAPDRAEWIVSAVASALDAAHARGLVHRDVKPANMLLDVRPGRPDHVYLSDFGLSKAALSTGGLSGGQFIGTVDYAAPEQILGRTVDGRTDQYALGCAAFELLCGRPPFSGKQVPATMYSHLSAKPPAATAARADLPAAVNGVFARVLAKSPADRYGSCQEFARALRAALGLRAYVPEAPAAPELATPQPGEAGDSTLHPHAVDQFAPELTELAAAGTDPRATSHFTVGPTAATRVWRARRLLVSGAVAVVLVAGAGAAVWFGRAPAARLTPASDHFTNSYASGLAISQLWTLGGTGGSALNVTMTISTTSTGPVFARLEEPLPAGTASNPASIAFSVYPTLITSTRLVWDLTVPGHGKDVVVRYQVPEQPNGASSQQLDRYTQPYSRVSWQQVLVPIPRPGEMPKVWISPDKFSLKAGSLRRLKYHGRLASGKLASGAELAGAVWWTSDSRVAVVDSSGVVTGEGPGSAEVYVNIDGTQAQAMVVVSGSRKSGSASPPAGDASQPPVQSSTSPASTSSPDSPTSTPTTTPTTTPATNTPPTSQSPGPGVSSAAFSSQRAVVAGRERATWLVRRRDARAGS